MTRHLAYLIAFSMILSMTPVTAAAAVPDAPNPAVAAALETATQVTAGVAHTCALTARGGVYCWGRNNSGQLGDGTTIERAAPVAVSGLDSGVKAIAAGGSYTCALTTGGGILCWGSNAAGQLGDGTTHDHWTPNAVSGLSSGVIAIAAGGAHNCALAEGSTVQCWGANSSGQIGDGSTNNRSTPRTVSGLPAGVTAIAAGESHTCALEASGAMQCWGANDYGQLGNGTTTGRTIPGDVKGLPSGVNAIAAGGAHTCALTASGAMQCWGRNSAGQLGDGTLTGRTVPAPVSGLSSGVARIAAGNYHTCALTLAGRMLCWGQNDYYQLGDSTTKARATPDYVHDLSTRVTGMAAGWQHTCAMTATGGLKCWGRNDSGQVGEGTTAVRSAPVDVASLATGVSTIEAGTYHTCAVTATGSATCWGRNDAGQLGDGTTTDRWSPGAVSGLTTGVVALAAGYSHTCALEAAGGVQCWGANTAGQLGDGTTTAHATAVDVSGLVTPVSAIAAGDNHTCALTAGVVRCWGANTYGQLGNGTTADQPTPVVVLGLAAGVTAITAGRNHTCARTAAGAAVCWGRNDSGQLGHAGSTPAAVTGLASGVTAVAAGGSHTSALTAGGAAKCWGDNFRGQIGDGTTLEDRPLPVQVSGLSSGVTAIAGGDFHTCALTTDGLKCWGWNSYGQVGDGTSTDRPSPAHVSNLDAGATAVTDGLLHTCAIIAGGSVKCWGYNNYGQLGVRSSSTPVDVVGFGHALRLTFLPVLSR